MTTGNRRLRTDLELVRAALDHAQSVGVLAAARRAGVDYSTVYGWRARREASDGSWPTDQDIVDWRAADQRADVQRAAHRRWQHRTMARRGPLTLDSTGTIRRLRALLALGWRYSDIAALTPYQMAFIGAVASGRRAMVNADTADLVRAVYDRLSGTPGPSGKTRAYARNRGWPAPLAWEDGAIDDPAAKPIGGAPSRVGLDEVAIHRAMHGDPVQLTSAERAEAVLRLLARGYTHAQVAGRLGITDRSVARIKAAA